MVVHVTRSRWQGSSVPAGQDAMLQTTGGAVEIRFSAGALAAEWPSGRILILQPGAAVAEPVEVQHRAVPRPAATTSAGSAGAWSTHGLSDNEEPTWEDAAWQ